MTDQKDHGAGLAAGPPIPRSKSDLRQAAIERHTTARLAFCRALWDACLDSARSRECEGRGESEENCMSDGTEIHEWCPKCLLGEASVQLAWLLTQVGTGNQASTSEIGSVPSAAQKS